MGPVSHALPLLACSAAMLWGQAPPEPAAPVLPPTAASELRTLLAIGGDDDPWAIRAAVDRDRARVTVTRRADRATLLAVTFVHPSAAPAEAPRVGGVALVEAAGPLPVADLVARMAATGRSVTWTVPPPPPPSSDADLAAIGRLHDALRAAAYRVDVGDLDEARAALKKLPSTLPVAITLDAAILYRRLGDAAEVQRLVATLPATDPIAHATGQVILEAEPDLDALLGERKAQSACELVPVARALSRVGQGEAALALATRTRDRAPDCARAWESVIHRHLELRRFDAALPLAEEALRRFPEDADLAHVAASVFQATEQYRRAVPLLSDIVRRDDTQSGAIRLLLSCMLRDVDHRDAYRDELAARHAADPTDHVSQFLLGVIHHYENDFERSNALLAPLEPRLGHEDRLHIYRAMNDFNLGKTPEALARLNRRATDQATPDPDIFYCRAEIQRDTDRAQARADLKRYLSDAGAYLANPDKEVRVERMVADLDACLADGRPKCESEWEHPRHVARPAGAHGPDTGHDADPSDQAGGRVPWAIGFVLLLVTGAGFVALRRRRTP